MSDCNVVDTFLCIWHAFLAQGRHLLLISGVPSKNVNCSELINGYLMYIHHHQCLCIWSGEIIRIVIYYAPESVNDLPISVVCPYTYMGVLMYNCRILQFQTVRWTCLDIVVLRHMYILLCASGISGKA